MRVIDLLNKIANGEKVPKKIQVYSDIFVLNCSNMIYESERARTNLLSIYNGYILNYEVAIIEDKKIETIEYDRDCTFEWDFEELYNKINEIIDKINEMREDK